MGRAADASSKELREVMRAHPGDIRELLEAEVPGEVLSDVVEHSPEPTPGHSSSRAPRGRASHAIATYEIHGQRTRQRFAVKPAGGGAVGKIRPHCLQDGANVGIDE